MGSDKVVPVGEDEEDANAQESKESKEDANAEDAKDAKDGEETKEAKDDSESSSSSSADGFGEEAAAETVETSPQRPQTSRRRMSTDVNMELLRKKMEEKAAKRKVLEERKQKAKFRRSIANFMDGPYMTTLSVSLTFWALLGDDIRILTTNRPADIVFNFVTITCLSFFGLEVVLSSFCKKDYFLGFFFTLDCVSTASLILDLTWVADTLVSDDMAMGDKARGGRTARLGASVGRVVRVIRLVRIVKLYKAAYERLGREPKKGTQQPGDETVIDDWDNPEQEEAAEKKDRRESAVGRKLVALTTRRVIILVLAMLLCMPAFSVTNYHPDMTSASYGANTVFEKFVQMRAGQANRTLYEESMLKYMYYHNWFSGNGPCAIDEACPAYFFSHAFWVGFSGRDKSFQQLRDLSAEAALQRDSVVSWDSYASTMSQKNFVYVTGDYPSQAKELLSENWTIECKYGGWNHVGTSLLSSSYEEKITYEVKCPDDLRPQERFTIRPTLLTQDQFNDWHLAFFFDARPFVKQESLFNIMLTAFICIVLCVASMQFSKDANALVLRPVERMIEKVNLIRDNPLAAMKMADDEFKGEEMKKFRNANSREKQHVWLEKYRMGWLSSTVSWFSFKGATREDAMMETAILEKTIIKLGSLLALGFGEAGASIVADNMQGLDSAGVNAMVPGRRVDCIIGSACIRDFSTATEVLQGKVMTFVNQIAEIVHGLVCEFHGAPNKNSGDRFLLIWRLGSLNSQEQQTRLADMAMVSCIRILGCAHSNRTLADYRTHPGLIQRLGQHCRVNLSFGLHRGWAIEGAVGSEFKIDASYLSPNVSIAESLEHATKVYSVNMLVSQDCVTLCSKVLARQCRLIDKVTMKGSKLPLSLYCYDVETQRMPVREYSNTLEWNVRQRFKARQLFEVEKTRKWASDVNIVHDFVTQSDDVKILRKVYTTDFQQLFNMGYQNYSEGEWRVARRLFKETQNMLGFQDGPSTTLLDFMETYHFEAPPKWIGVRDILVH